MLNVTLALSSRWEMPILSWFSSILLVLWLAISFSSHNSKHLLCISFQINVWSKRTSDGKTINSHLIFEFLFYRKHVADSTLKDLTLIFISFTIKSEEECYLVNNRIVRPYFQTIQWSLTCRFDIQWMIGWDTTIG